VARSASEKTWAEVKRLYCETDETVEKIAARHGLSPAAIFKRRAAEGWPPRRPRRAKPAGARRFVKASGGGPARGARGALEERLYQVMIRKLEKLEQRMNAGDVLSPADNEREMREIGAMIRNFEKVKEVGNGEKGAGSVRESSSSLAAAHAERMRQEIAERLERLHERSRSREGSK